MIIRSPSEPTPVSKLITMFKTASCLRRFFEDTDNAQGGASYELCLQVDREIRDIIQQAPTYLRPNADLESLPPFAQWMNHYFIMSVSSKPVTARLYRAESDPLSDRSLTNFS